jgi:hypothetical protein
MQLDGQVWFSFTNPDVWVLYRFVRALASAGHPVNLDWVPLFDQDEATSMSTFLAIDDPDDRGRFLHAMLGLVHIEGDRFDDDELIAKALSVSGVSSRGPAAGNGELTSLAAEAESLGVRATPTLYRHGPASHIRLTEVALMGDVAATAAMIVSIADDDGVWEISKP